MSETLKDYLVGINFKVDSAGAGRANQAVSDLDAVTKELGSVLLQAASAFQQLISQMQGGKSAVSETSGAMKQNTQSATQMTAAMKQANQHGKLPGLTQGKKNVTAFDNAIKKATGELKKYAKVAVGYLVGNNVVNTFKKVMEFNEGLVASARKLGKTVEQTRAYNLALEIMGKTAKEIEADKTLKNTFDNLKAIGESLALPQAAAGLRNIGAVKDSLMELKLVGSYALQWIYYRMQEVAAGPLKETRDILGNIREWFSGNLKNVADGVAQAFSWIVQIINSVAIAVGAVVGWIDTLPDSVKIAGAVILGVILMIKSKTALVMGVVGVILLLIDDLVTHLQGGESVFGDFWDACIAAYNKVEPYLRDAMQTFDEIVTKVKTAWTEASDLKDFIARLVFTDEEYEADASWDKIAAAIWKRINEGLQKGITFTKDTIGKIVFGEDYTPDKSWLDIALKIFAYIYLGMQQKLTFTKDTIGRIALGEGYTPDTSWGDIANAIFEKITDGLSAGLQFTKDTIGKIVLGGEYTPDVTWGNIAKAIWDIVDTGLKGSRSFIKNTIGNIIFGGSYTPDVSWNKIGQGIWSLIKNALSGGITFVSSMLGSIIYGEESYTPDSSWDKIGNGIIDHLKELMTDATDLVTGLVTGISASLNTYEFGEGALAGAGTFVTNLATKLFDAKTGVIPNISSFVSGLVNKLATDVDWSKLGTGLGKVANQLLEHLGEAINLVAPTAGTVAENTVDSVLNLGTAIVNSLTHGIDAVDFTKAGNAAGKVANSLLKSITNIFSSENITQVGAAAESLASSIMGAVAEFMNGAEDSQVGKNAGLTLGKIVQNIFEGAKNLTENSHIISFVENIGQAISNLSSVAGQFLGTFAGDLLKWIFTGKAIEDAFNIGVNLFSLIFKGIQYAFGGAASLITSLLDGLLVSLGIVDPDVRAETLAKSKMAAQLKQTLKDAIFDAVDITFDEDISSEDMGNVSKAVFSALAIALTDNAPSDEELKELFEVPIAEEFFSFDKLDSVFDHFKDSILLLKESGSFGIDGIKDIFTTAFSELGLEIGDTIDESLWDTIAEYVQKGGDVNDLFSGLLLNLGIGAEEAGELTGENSPAQKAAEELGIKTAENVTDALNKGLEEGANEANIVIVDTTTTSTENMETLQKTAEDTKNKVNASLSGVSGAELISTFTEIESSVSSSMNAVASVVEDSVSRMKAALSGMNLFGFIGGLIPHAANGGIFSSRTRVELGEDGKEYVIPVTKPGRAWPLILSALKDMGFTLQGYRDAIQSLGGGADKNYTPGYALGSIGSNVTHNNNTNTVQAPATINVFGRDANAIARQVAYNQENLVMRNLKSLILS